MIISYRYKYVYFCTPKTASTSISTILVDEFEGERYGDYHNLVVPPECLSFTTIFSVRHPYTRFISLYNQARNHPEHRCYEVSQNMSFGEYLEWFVDLSKKPVAFISKDDLINVYSRPPIEIELMKRSINDVYGRDNTQTNLLKYAIGINYLDKIDYIIKYEELNRDFNALPFVKQYRELPVLNKAEVRHETLIDSKAEELLYEWSKEDLYNFEYERTF